jgi:hypothetical protein
LLFILRIHNSQQAAFGTPSMIAKAWYFEPELIATARNKARQNPHAVPQLIRIAGLMNVGFNARAVRTNNSPLFNVFLFGVTQDVAIYILPGLIRDALNIAIQGRFFKALIGNADATKPPQAARVDDVEGQFLISETEKSFDYDTSQHLVSTHTLGAGTLGLGLTCVQVLQNILTDGKKR